MRLRQPSKEHDLGGRACQPAISGGGCDGTPPYSPLRERVRFTTWRVGEASVASDDRFSGRHWSLPFRRCSLVWSESQDCDSTYGRSPRFHARLSSSIRNVAYRTTQRFHFFGVVCRKLMGTTISWMPSFHRQNRSFQSKQGNGAQAEWKPPRHSSQF